LLNPPVPVVLVTGGAGYIARVMVYHRNWSNFVVVVGLLKGIFQGHFRELGKFQGRYRRRHRPLLHAACEKRNGKVFSGRGDAARY
jgi:hypothetical protein